MLLELLVGVVDEELLEAVRVRQEVLEAGEVQQPDELEVAQVARLEKAGANRRSPGVVEVVGVRGGLRE